VMKLLAKTAEQRYQTAAGVEADLRRCLVECESHGRIVPFPLGRCALVANGHAANREGEVLAHQRANPVGESNPCSGVLCPTCA
jgi:hypothetical protein